MKEREVAIKKVHRGLIETWADPLITKIAGPITATMLVIVAIFCYIW